MHCLRWRVGAPRASPVLGTWESLSPTVGGLGLKASRPVLYLTKHLLDTHCAPGIVLGGGPSKTALVPKWLTAYLYAQTCR